MDGPINHTLPAQRSEGRRKEGTGRQKQRTGYDTRPELRPRKWPADDSKNLRRRSLDSAVVAPERDARSKSSRLAAQIRQPTDRT
jgi:hypothetical protein